MDITQHRIGNYLTFVALNVNHKEKCFIYGYTPYRREIYILMVLTSSLKFAQTIYTQNNINDLSSFGHKRWGVRTGETLQLMMIFKHRARSCNNSSN
jgi:hypothetical protein